MAPKAWKAYCRLKTDPRTEGVKKSLLKRGMSLGQFELLLQTISALPTYFGPRDDALKETVAHLKKYRQLGKAMVRLARSAIDLPEVPFYCIDIEAMTGRNANPKHVYPIAGFLERAAAQIEERATAEMRMLTAPNAGSTGKRKRIITRETFTLRQIFDAIGRLLPVTANRQLPPRAPNQEAEILASIVLNKRIRTGELSRLRQRDRRRYLRRENAV